MKKIFILLFISLFCYCNSNGQNIKKENIDKVKPLFEIVEKKMQEHYDFIRKKRVFEDPLGRISFFFECVNENAPQLLSDNPENKKGLLNILVDKSFKRNLYTDNDIAYLLYNSNIDDYICIVQHVCDLFKHQKIKYQTLGYFLFQDPNVSCLLAKSYRENKVSLFLSDILKDKTLVDFCQNYNKTFIVDIENLKSGKTWNGDQDFVGLKEGSIVQIPILDTLKIK